MGEIYDCVTSPWWKSVSEPPATGLRDPHDHHSDLGGHLLGLFPLEHASLSGQLLYWYDAVGFFCLWILF